jgi:hypothetical protein
MPTPIINIYEPNLNDSLEKRVKDLTNAYIDVMQQIRYLLGTLDSKNVKRITTELTKISSDRGETEILGPLIVMKDKQAVPIVRLQMGYDPASGLFVFKMYNATGDTTVSLDSNGDQIVERGTFKGSITIGTGDNVFKADSNGIYLGDATYADAPFKVSMAGAAEASNLDITGGSINVDTDLYVGNNIYLGDMEEASKGIYFFDAGAGLVSYIGLTELGVMKFLTPGSIDLDSAENVNISGAGITILSGTGGALTLSKVGPENIYFYHAGAGHLYLLHDGTGDLWLRHEGTGVLKIEAVANISIESTTGYTFADGTWRFEHNPYLGTVDDANKFLKKSEIEALIPSAPSGATGTFTTADGKTVTVSNGIVSSIV